MTKFVLQNNYFELNGEIKQQICETALVNKFAPPYARTLMDQVELEFLKTQNHPSTSRNRDTELKGIIQYLANLAEWLSVRLRTKCLWVRIPLLSLERNYISYYFPSFTLKFCKCH